MKSTSLLFAAAFLWVGSSVFAQPVVARGQVELTGCPNSVILCQSALVPIDQPARAGEVGTVLFYGDNSRMRLAAGSEFAAYGGIPVKPVFEPPLENIDAASAIKSINTQRIARRFRNEAQYVVTHDGLVLQSGQLMVDERASVIDVRVMSATISGANTRFAVTMLSPCSARVSVAEGGVKIALPGQAARMVRCGEFVMLNRDAVGHTLAGAQRLISESALAMTDQADLAAGMASRLAPVGECVDLAGDLDPVGELVCSPPAGYLGVPSVGTGPSDPFDLTHGILTGANAANVSGPVQSSEVP